MVRLPSWCWCSALEPSGGHWDAPAAAATAPATMPYTPVDAVTPGAGPAYGFFAGGGPSATAAAAFAFIAANLLDAAAAATAAAAAAADGLLRPDVGTDAAAGMLFTNRLRVRLSAFR